jgi:predicted XRE-type DNA-binding protein
MTQAEAAKVLGVTQARVSDLKRGKINRFSMDPLARLAARASPIGNSRRDLEGV